MELREYGFPSCEGSSWWEQKLLSVAWGSNIIWPSIPKCDRFVKKLNLYFSSSPQPQQHTLSKQASQLTKHFLKTHKSISMALQDKKKDVWSKHLIIVRN